MKNFFDPHRAPRGLTCLTFGCTLLVLLAGCGGGGGGGGSSNALAPSAGTQTPPPAASEFTAGQFSPSTDFSAQCAVPRAGNFPDSAGSSVDENNFLRSWSNETYLWYNEIVDVDPASSTTPDYFELMRTTQTTPSGAAKDNFHFSLDSEEWQALSQAGVSAGYGAEFALLSSVPPREIVVAFTEPNTPAAAVSLARGARILQVDGRDAVNGTTQADVDALNQGLFPAATGESHSFVVLDPDGVTERTVTMVSDQITEDPVQNVRIEEVDNQLVGYLTFNSHIRTAQDQLFDAMTEFASAGVSELVLDLRYNGGGFLVLANELASMIASPAASMGRVFEEIQFNNKHPSVNPVTGASLRPDFFRTTQVNLDTGQDGPELPTLNLGRVFILSGPGTCSASESIINGLRGIGVEVILIGDTTCGKPYGFYPTDNCGTTYFTVQFQGVNDMGFGAYSDGFSPSDLSQTEGVPVTGCAIDDDFSKPLGDPAEARLRAALEYIVIGTCPTPPPPAMGAGLAGRFGSSSTSDGAADTKTVNGAAAATAATANEANRATATTESIEAPRMPGNVRLR